MGPGAGPKYYINPNINCKHSGIYGITCNCVDQYSGKTTVTNGKRFGEHWSKSTSVRTHLNSCSSKPTLGEVKVQFLENVWDRGKYSLSEREYLWNKRLKGTINIQKVLSKQSVLGNLGVLFLFLTCLYHLCVFILADDGSRARLEHETCTRGPPPRQRTRQNSTFLDISRHFSAFLDVSRRFSTFLDTSSPPTYGILSIFYKLNERLMNF